MAIYIYVLTVLIALAATQRFGKRKLNLPPGPPGLPILGNMHQLPPTFLHRKLTAWSKVYGPIFSLSVAGQPWLVLNTHTAAADVLDRHSASTSDRPPSIKAQEFLARGNALVAEPHGPLWRLFRKGSHESLNIRACVAYLPLQTSEARFTALNILLHPSVPLSVQMSRHAASVVWRVLYGGSSLPLGEKHDAQKIEETMDYLLKATLPLNSVVDMLPFLAPVIRRVGWLRRKADEWFEETTAIFERFYAAALEGREEYRSTCKIFEDMVQRGEITRRQAAWAPGALFMAGQDTTATTLQWFVQALLLYPDVQQRAQEELDAVVGDRPPTFEDRGRLPYVEACVREVLRWRPSAPLSIPHWASEEFEYNGWVIPKGTFILDNLWAILHDPQLYPDPESFDPGRFLTPSGELRKPPADTHDDLLGFGHGRRVCPGRDLAVNSLFITIATLLWAVEFTCPVDEQGRERRPDPEGGRDMFVAVHPEEFGWVGRGRRGGVVDRLQGEEDE